MHEHPRCNIDVVAAGRHCEVQIFRDCGAVHIHIGPFSLRLRADIYRSIGNTLAAAISHMDTAGGLATEGLTPSPQLKH